MSLRFMGNLVFDTNFVAIQVAFLTNKKQIGQQRFPCLLSEGEYNDCNLALELYLFLGILITYPSKPSLENA